MSASGRSRAAALALLAGIVVLIGAAVISPAALHWTEKGNAIRAERAKTQQAKDREASRDALIATSEAWNAFSRDPSSGFSLAESDEIAIESTRARCEDVFSRLGGSMASFDATSAPAGRVGVTKLSVDVRGTVPRMELGGFLGELESKPPFVIIEEFEASLDAGDTLSLHIVGELYRLEGAGL